MRMKLRSLTAVGALIGLLAVAAPAQASVVTQRYEEISYDVNTCTGETVRLEGSYLLTVRTFGEDGLAVRYTYTLTGTGQTTGLTYTVNTQSAFTVSNNDTDFESTFRSTMVSRGPAPDQVVIGHISSDPDEPSTITTQCRG
jgi:hypothetical protein